MTDKSNSTHAQHTKKAWIIYIALTVMVVAILVLLVAQDNEERFFFGLMPIASAYVFRPTQRYMNKMVLKFTGVSPPTEE